MELEDRIHLFTPSGEKVSLPESLDELEMDYFHGADLAVEPSENGLAKDIGRVITLRPSVHNKNPRESRRSPEYLYYRGIFAYGHEEEGHVNFGIYTPHQGYKRTLPTTTLRNAVAALALSLLESGHKPIKVEYHRLL